MTTHAAVMDVSQQDFQTAVLQRSAAVPVVVDFWAPWCGPCRVLGPVLERLATEMQGAFVLAKVNVDQNQRLAGEFGVQGIPAVKAFRNGKVVDQFTGALPESQVRTWLKKIVPSQVDQLVAQATELERSEPTKAAGLYRQVLQTEANNSKALLGLGRVLTLQGDPEAATILKQIKAGTPEHAAAQAMLSLTDFLSAAQGTLADAREQLNGNANDTSARWQLAAHLARNHQWDDALRHLLTIVQRDRGWNNDAARRAMLAVFAVLGENDPVSAHYRRQLASALF